MIEGLGLIFAMHDSLFDMFILGCDDYDQSKEKGRGGSPSRPFA
jgi:hypothetical protein